MKFTVVIKKNGEDEIFEYIDAWTVEEAREIAFHEFGNLYKKELFRIELAPQEKFDNVVHWALEDDFFGSPTIEQEFNAIYDFEAIQRKSTSLRARRARSRI